MILQAGFDLGTFSILFNRTYSQSVLDATGINTAAAAGRYSQPSHLRHFDGLKTEPEKLCFLEIAAAIWHEKRHFFDTLLTNLWRVANTSLFSRDRLCELDPAVPPLPAAV